MPNQRKKLEITGSLLQDVSIPSAKELEEGNVELFLGGDLPAPASIDPQDAEVNKFLSGGK